MNNKIVVDTNILFSAILKPESKIGRILIRSRKYFQFYICDLLKVELARHQQKLLKFSKLDPFELEELRSLLLKNITFISEEILPKDLMVSSEQALINIDLNDTPFVALAKHLNAKLWTGDKELSAGLQGTNFIETISTFELSLIFNELEKE